MPLSRRRRRAPVLTTKGGPGISTITPTVVLYERAFANPDVGSAAAIGVVMTVASLLIVLVILTSSPP